MSAAPDTLSGGCHCGNVHVEFETARSPSELGLRLCTCSFCRAHGARTTADPQGRLRLRISDSSAVSRYQFGHKTADFLICQRCGVYVAAIMTHGSASYGILNVNVLDVREVFRQAGAAVDYEGEQAQERRERRATTWTPATVIG